MQNSWRAVCAIGVLGLAGCTTSADEGGQPEAVAFNDSSSATTSSTMGPESAAPTTEEESLSDGPSLEISAEMLEGMLASEAGRGLIVQGLADETGVSTEEANCLVDSLGPAELAGAATSFMGGAATEFSPEQAESIGVAAESCGLSAEVLLGG